MPKSFSSAEKHSIRAKLHKAGLARFTRQGVRATRIDDLCRDVGIAKGSFYAFHSSKEDLLLAIAAERDKEHKTQMRRFLKSAHASPAEQADEFFDMLAEKIRSDPMLSLMLEHSEMQYLLRKIPPDRMEAKARSDRAFIEEISGLWSEADAGNFVTPDTVQGLMILMVTLIMQTRTIPAPQMKIAQDLLRETFIERMTRGTAQTNPNSTKVRNDDKD